MVSELIESARYPRHRLTVAARAAPTLIAPALAAALAAAYLLAAPRSADLAAQLLRAKLFAAEGPLGVWSNWWYAGHALPGYSVLSPALASALTPHLAGALAAVAAAVCFDRLARNHFGPAAWLGSTWFAAGTATELLSGRLAFMTGLAFGLAALLALDERRRSAATIAALLAGLTSPVAAVFAALAAAALAISARDRLAWAVALTALLPVAGIAAAFPTPGHEPFALSALLPVPLIAAVLGALSRAGRHRTLQTGLVLYAAATVAVFAVATPLGGNVVRLAWLAAGPLAGLLGHPSHRRILVALALPLLYLQWQGAVRDVSAAQQDPSTTAAYYRPLLGYLARRPGPPFRIEIPLTREHWESLEVAPRFPLARGWERQLDIADNPLFYDGGLTPRRYDAWLHATAVRFVALPDVALDPSAQAEARLIRQGQSFLRLAATTGHWRIYAVRAPTPIVSGAAALTKLGADTLTLAVHRPGTALIRMRWSPFWHGGRLTRAGTFIRLHALRPGTIVLSNEL